MSPNLNLHYLIKGSGEMLIPTGESQEVKPEEFNFYMTGVIFICRLALRNEPQIPFLSWKKFPRAIKMTARTMIMTSHARK